MSSEGSPNRNKIFVALLTLAALALFAGNADARNPDLSNWAVNLSGMPGDETAGEIWNDLSGNRGGGLHGACDLWTCAT